MATIPIPHLWSAGDYATSGNMNTLTDSINFLLGGAASNRPSVDLTLNTAQSINNAAETTVDFDTVVADTDSGYSAGTYTVHTSGLWLFSCAAEWAANTTGNRFLHLLASGRNAFSWISAGIDNVGRSSASIMVRLNAGQTVYMTMYQTSGAALATASGNAVYLSGVWLAQ